MNTILKPLPQGEELVSSPLPANGPWSPFYYKEWWVLLFCVAREVRGQQQSPMQRRNLRLGYLQFFFPITHLQGCSGVLGRLSEPAGAGLIASDCLQTVSASGAPRFNLTFTSWALEIYV